MVGDTVDVIGEEVDIVADEVGAGGVAGHDFGEDFIVAVVEEDIVAGAFAMAIEVVDDVVYGDLEEIGEGVDVTVGIEDDVEFAETDSGAIGDVEFDAVTLSDDDSVEFSLVE